MTGKLSSRTALGILAVGFFAVNFVYGLHIGEADRMYSPVYRWRQAALVALSRDATPPAHSYEIYRSLLNYFIANGMAILGDEYHGPPKNPPEWLFILRDGARINSILSGATRVSVDPSLPPDIMRGNEIGYADYFWLAFRIFGTRVSSLYFLYFSLFAVSLGAFIFVHGNSVNRLFLLCLYLSAHFYSMLYGAPTIDLYAVHNSRTFSAIAILPGLHLALRFLSPPDERNRKFIAGDVVQVLVLMFLLHSRIETIWVTVLVVSSSIVYAVRAMRKRRGRFLIWGVGLPVLVSLAVVLAWPRLMLSPTYRGENGRHPFWHVIYTGLVSAHPKLQKLYLHADDPYSDNMGYNAVLRELRANGGPSLGIGYVQDGKVYIDVTKGFASYDELLRPIVLRMIRDHPVEVVESFYYKAKAQIEFFGNFNWTGHSRRGAVSVFSLRSYYFSLTMAALAAVVLVVFPNVWGEAREDLLPVAKSMLWFLVFSLFTPALDSTPTAFGTLVTYVMLFLAAVSLTAVSGLRLASAGIRNLAVKAA